METREQPPGPAVASRCPICLHDIDRPTSLKTCSHTFCYECIHKWASTRRQPRCPLCQAEVAVLCLEDGREEQVRPPETSADEGPDLSCLDHAYFKTESDRLLRRAVAAQLHVVRAAYNSGRRGSAAADDASSALQQVIGALQEHKHDMEQEVPFDPEALLGELYSLESIVHSVQAGEWASSGQLHDRGPQLLSADDAVWEDADDQIDDYDFDGSSQVDNRTSRRLDRAALSSTPGRRPTPGKGRRTSGSSGQVLAGTPPGAGLVPSQGSRGNLSGGRRR